MVAVTVGVGVPVIIVLVIVVIMIVAMPVGRMRAMATMRVGAEAMEDDDEGYGVRRYGGGSLIHQPLFWVALISGAFNVFLLFLVLSR